MAFDQKRCERLARATASDMSVYNVAKIEQALVEDNFYEALAEQLEESRKNFAARSKEAAETNILERAIVDVILAPMAADESKKGKYPMF